MALIPCVRLVKQAKKAKQKNNAKQKSNAKQRKDISLIRISQKTMYMDIYTRESRTNLADIYMIHQLEEFYIFTIHTYILLKMEVVRNQSTPF